MGQGKRTSSSLAALILARLDNIEQLVKDSLQQGFAFPNPLDLPLNRSNPILQRNPTFPVQSQCTITSTSGATDKGAFQSHADQDGDCHVQLKRIYIADALGCNDVPQEVTYDSGRAVTAAVAIQRTWRHTVARRSWLCRFRAASAIQRAWANWRAWSSRVASLRACRAKMKTTTQFRLVQKETFAVLAIQRAWTNRRAWRSTATLLRSFRAKLKTILQIRRDMNTASVHARALIDIVRIFPARAEIPETSRRFQVPLQAFAGSMKAIDLNLCTDLVRGEWDNEVDDTDLRDYGTFAKIDLCKARNSYMKEIQATQNAYVTFSNSVVQWMTVKVLTPLRGWCNGPITQSWFLHELFRRGNLLCPMCNSNRLVSLPRSCDKRRARKIKRVDVISFNAFKTLDAGVKVRVSEPIELPEVQLTGDPCALCSKWTSSPHAGFPGPLCRCAERDLDRLHETGVRGTIRKGALGKVLSTSSMRGGELLLGLGEYNHYTDGVDDPTKASGIDSILTDGPLPSRAQYVGWIDAWKLVKESEQQPPPAKGKKHRRKT